MLNSQSDISFWPSIPEPYFPREPSEKKGSGDENGLDIKIYAFVTPSQDFFLVTKFAAIMLSSGSAVSVCDDFRLYKFTFSIFTVGKLCDNPLLRDARTFPESLFSGSGDSSKRYKRARITGSGWCPSGSGTTYLLLDLQKEYHTTQVAVMADREQTKWSESYSMTYSHDKSYKNSIQVFLIVIKCSPKMCV